MKCVFGGFCVFCAVVCDVLDLFLHALGIIGLEVTLHSESIDGFGPFNALCQVSPCCCEC